MTKRELSAIEWCIGLTQVYCTTNGRNDPGYAAKARKEFRALMALAKWVNANHGQKDMMGRRVLPRGYFTSLFKLIKLRRLGLLPGKGKP